MITYTYINELLPQNGECSKFCNILHFMRTPSDCFLSPNTTELKQLQSFFHCFFFQSCDISPSSMYTIQKNSDVFQLHPLLRINIRIRLDNVVHFSNRFSPSNHFYCFDYRRRTFGYAYKFWTFWVSTSFTLPFFYTLAFRTFGCVYTSTSRNLEFCFQWRKK